MKRLVEFDLKSGGTIIAEVDEQAGIVPAGLGADTIAKASQTFDAVVDKIAPAASAILNALRSMDIGPDEVQVEFGVKLNAKLGAPVLASADAEANYRVTLTWKALACDTKKGN